MSEKAVSEVLGMVIMLSIMIFVMGLIMLVGVPMIESGKFNAKMDVATNSFLSLQSNIEEVVRGPIWVRDPRDPNMTMANYLGPSRETEFNLMGGMISAQPNNTNITYTITNGANYTINLIHGNITYAANDVAIIYEDGAIIRKYEGGEPLMVSYPLMSIYNTGDGNITISIHVISLNGTLSSAGGDGMTWIDTRLKDYNQTISPKGFPNSNKTNIKITTNYPEVWKKFFDEKLRVSGLVQANKGSARGYNISGTNQLEVQIYGNNTNISEPDIYLSVYESKIDVKVR